MTNEELKKEILKMQSEVAGDSIEKYLAAIVILLREQNKIIKNGISLIAADEN